MRYFKTKIFFIDWKRNSRLTIFFLLIHEADLEVYIESLPDTMDCPLTWIFEDIHICTLLDLDFESLSRDGADNQNESLVIEPYGTCNFQF